MTANTPVDGIWEVKRTFTIPSLQTESEAQQLRHTLTALHGMKRVAVELEAQRIVLRYDASQLGWPTIVQTLVELKLPPANNWWMRFKERCYNFLDANARENANAPAPACCNKPPKL